MSTEQSKYIARDVTGKGREQTEQVKTDGKDNGNMHV